MSVFTWPVRIYFEDTDAGGVVYYGNYLKFYERARSEWLRSLGISQQQLADIDGVLFVVRNVTIDYHASAFLDDALTVQSEVTQVKRASIVFKQSIWRNETLLNTATVTIACVSREQLKPVAIPVAVALTMHQALPSA